MKIKYGRVELEMTVSEFIDFIQSTEPSVIMEKLRALEKLKGEKTEEESEA